MLTNQLNTTYLNQPTLFLLEESKDDAEIATELLYSEQISIESAGNGWLKVYSHIDGYTGYCREDGVKTTTLEKPFLSEATDIIARVSAVKAYAYAIKDTVKLPLASIPFEGRVKVLNSDDPRWLHVQLVDGQVGYIQKGQVSVNPPTLTLNEALEFALSLTVSNVAIPYSYGGRSMENGYDCSGFVQMLYRMMGVYLPRNARDQIKSAYLSPVAVSVALPGDLIFFGPDASKIRHVGIMLDDTHFVHANPRQQTGKEAQQGKITISSIEDGPWQTLFITAARLKGG